MAVRGGVGFAVPPPGDHGGDGAKLAKMLGVDPAEVLDLSASLNPLAPDPLPVISRHLDSVRRYPDPGDATRTLARTMGVAPSCLLLTNGGAEAIALVGAELGRGWVEEPDFGLYKAHLGELEPGAPRFRSNPHNPTGLLASADERAAVWDEAFFPLATGRWTRGDVSTGSIAVGSLTKLLACPGLRMGYVLAPDEELVSRLAERQPMWAVNAIAVAALGDLLDAVDLAAWSSRIVELRRDLCEVLSRHRLRPAPSDANYLLVDGADGLRNALARAGVLVRDCASFGLPGRVRIAVPDPSGLERLDAALEAVESGGWVPGGSR